jgi:hypothetical protein
VATLSPVLKFREPGTLAQPDLIIPDTLGDLGPGHARPAGDTVNVRRNHFGPV